MNYKLYTIDNQFIQETYDWPTNFTGIIKHSDGSKTWHSVGKRHRLDGPACEYLNGTKLWYIEGKLHRLGGPAIEYSIGEKHWFVDGKRHRIEGPAYEGSDGHKEWYIAGNPVTKEQHALLVDIMKLKGLT